MGDTGGRGGDEDPAAGGGGVTAVALFRATCGGGVASAPERKEPTSVAIVRPGMPGCLGVYCGWGVGR